MKQLDLGAEAQASGAILSPCGRYRYRLWRRWSAAGRRVVWVMLNPSTADASIDDPTIRRCLGFSKAWGYTALEVVNLFALRATDPAVLGLAGYELARGPDNERHILESCQGADLVIAAWGAHETAGYAEKTAAELGRAGIALHCLGKTTQGHPRHPLYCPSAWLPQLYRGPR
jgi:hypothetical protein